MSYLVDRSGFSPELITDLLEQLPQSFVSAQIISEFALSSVEQVNYVAFDKKKFEPVGVALVAHTGNGTSELTLIAVHPGHQGEMVGKQLLARIDQDLATDQVPQLVVSAPATQQYPGAASFFEAVGFQADDLGKYLVRKLPPLT